MDNQHEPRADGAPDAAVSPPTEVDSHLVARNAGDAVDAAHHAAELLISQASIITSLAKTIEAEAQALALDIVSRSERFASLVGSFEALTAELRDNFTKQRDLIEGFSIPRAGPSRAI